MRGGAVVHGDVEGFSAGSHQFDSDITEGRHPRAAIGLTRRNEVLAVACDGRADDEAGLSMPELAEAMAALGAVQAMNLDGGGSTSLVCGGQAAQRPARGARHRAARWPDGPDGDRVPPPLVIFPVRRTTRGCARSPV